MKVSGGMSLRRERWCYAGGWFSRLDINIYKISLKTSILLMYLDSPHPGYQRHESTTQWLVKKLNKRGLSTGGTLASQMHIMKENYGNNHTILMVRTVYKTMCISESNPFSLSDEKIR